MGTEVTLSDASQTPAGLRTERRGGMVFASCQDL